MTQHLRVFISSPGDVRAAREIAAQIIERLAKEFARFFELEPYLWESEAVIASGHYQDSIDLPSTFEVVVIIVWTRLGTLLPVRTPRREYRGADGRAPVTGTEWEFEEALQASRRTGKPDVLVYRCTQPATFEVKEAAIRQEQIDQFGALERFWDRHFRDDSQLGYRMYQDNAEFASVFEANLRRLLDRRLAQLAPATYSGNRAWFKAPFRGLESYEFEHAPIYFGQDDALAKAMLQLTAGTRAGKRFLLILGASGSGKSSLVKAGLLPKLFVQRRVPGLAFARRVVFRPSDRQEGKDLFDALASQLTTVRGVQEGLPELIGYGQTVEDLATHLRQARSQPGFPFGTALGKLAADARRHGALLEGENAGLILVLDQLEELFTDESLSNKDRNEFVELIEGLAQTELVWIVATMRKDFWHRADDTPVLVHLAEDGGRLELLPPTPVQVGLIIKRPAEAAALTFEPHPITGVPLSDAIAEEVAKAPGALPLLSYLLDQLYRVDVLEGGHSALRYVTYEQLGKLEGAIATKADSVLAQCTPEVRRALGSVLYALVQLGVGDGDVERAVARRVPLRAFRPGTPGRALVDALLEPNARLLVSDAETTGDAMLRVAHEALISRWELAREFVQANIESLKIRRRIEERYALWLELQNQGHPVVPRNKGSPGRGPLQGRFLDRIVGAEPGLLTDIDSNDGKRLLCEQRDNTEPHLISFIERSIAQETRRRNRTVRILTIVSIFVTCLAAFALTAGYLAGQRQRSAERQAAATLKAQAQLLTELALSRQQDGQTGEALNMILEVLSGADSSHAPAAAIDVLQRIRAVDYQTAVLEGHTDMLETAVYSPDGRQILTAARDRTARLWDARSGLQLSDFLGHTDMVLTAAFSPDGRRILTASADDTARVWDVRTHRPVLILSGHTNWVRCAAYSPDGKHIVTASYDGTARIWDAQTGAQTTLLKGHQNSVEWAAYSPDGTLIVTASLDKTARIWDARSGRVIRTLDGHSERVATAAFSPDGQHIVTASFDQTARIWNTKTGALERVLSGHSDRLESAVYSPDGRRIVTAAADNTARVWDASSGILLATLAGHSDLVLSANYSPDGRHIVTASYDQTARIWDAEMAGPRLLLTGHTAAINSAMYSSDGKRIVTASRDRTARLWDAGTGVALSVLRGHEDAVNWAGFSADDKRIVSVSFDRTARVWNSETGQQQLILRGHTDVVSGANFSRDDTQIATVSGLDHTLRLWDSHTGLLLKTLSTGDAQCTDPTFSPDGRKVAAACSDRLAHLWNFPAASEFGVLRGHNKTVNSIRFSRDGREIVTASDDQTARIWDAATVAPLNVLQGFGGPVNIATMLPDGLVVLLTGDGIVRVVEVATAAPLSELPSEGSGTNALAVSPDGGSVATVSNDHLVRIWALRPTPPLQQQIDWYHAANFGHLNESERMQLGELPDPSVKTWRTVASACDAAAGAVYDPERRAPGVTTSAMDGTNAIAVCSPETSQLHDDPRRIYELGRARYAQREFNAARSQFERASSQGYHAADIDWADLLLNPAAGTPNPVKAASLYEIAWHNGVTVAAARLGELREARLSSEPSGELAGSANQDARALDWYQRGAQVHDPTALGHLADLTERAAVADPATEAARHKRVEALGLYACAAELARREQWPDDAWSAWRHRRASLARELASEGMVTSVASTYRAATTLNKKGGCGSLGPEYLSTEAVP